jgi:hypothetical protein
MRVGLIQPVWGGIPYGGYGVGGFGGYRAGYFRSW